MLISIVIPLFNEEEMVHALYDRLSSFWRQARVEPGTEWELICINDGSHDRTLELLLELHRADRRVKVIDLSRNFNQQIATSAGLVYAQGDAVIVMDADLQDPPEVMNDLIAKWREGYEVVYAIRRSREGETWFKRLTSRIFYRLMRYLMSVELPLDTGDFRLLDRKVVRELAKMEERHRFIRGLSSWVGFRQTGVYFDRSERFAGATKYPLRSMLRISLDAVTGFSYQPLYLASYLGFLLAVLALVGIALVIILRLSGFHALTGQATTLVTVLLLCGVQLIFLGIIGAYLGRIYDEVKGRPLFIVNRAWGWKTETPPATDRVASPPTDSAPAPDAVSPAE